MKLRTLLITLVGSLFVAPLGTMAQEQEQCEVGIWYPYISNDGVPPLSSFTGRGLNTTFLTGDIDASILNTYDVLFFGRSGMAGQWPSGAGVITDIDALIQWVSDGGSIMGESNSLIYDSDAIRATDWSSRLSEIAGVSGGADGGDSGVTNPSITVTAPGHPITQGLPANFTLNGSHSQENSSALDLGKNPTATEVATSNSNPIIAAEYGNGRSVYLPTAAGYVGMDWGANTDYENLFLNATEWLCDTTRINTDAISDIETAPVPALSANNLAILVLLVLISGAVLLRRHTGKSSQP
jgi:hypothetical protein